MVRISAVETESRYRKYINHSPQTDRPSQHGLAKKAFGFMFFLPIKPGPKY